jgi:uncharacterized damage-inducible protein DinB
MPTKIPPPAPGEYLEYYQRYIDKVAHEADALVALRRQLPAIQELSRLLPAQAGFRYAPGKWSVKQVVGHMSDAERIFSYRLLRAARGDETPLASFDENAYVETANFDARSIEDLGEELIAVRASTLELLGSLDEARLTQTTVASGATVSVRALAFIIAGHTVHHLQILDERYKVEVA